MTDYEFVKLTLENGIATIALNSPNTLNAISQKMRIEIMEVVSKVEVDSSVRAVVFTGEGRAFCSGADLSEGMPGYDSFVDQCAAEYEPWLMAIHNSDKLYIAAINGAAAGIGSAVAMNCDLIMMADDAYIYQAFSAIGLIPDGGATWLLLQKLGYQRAIEMAVDAGRIYADECLRLGIANKVVPADALRYEAQAWAEKIACGPPLAQAAVKSLMRKASNMSYKQVIDEEAELQSELVKTEDSRNAVKAFFAKQKPVFNGR